ncbi:YegS/Rv2252/BmrU family lipid kinase [Halobacillus litoralis]|uniref:YegS/Rv2252/BmrU family lipid kinase n=1 Tax=Halobacillus litoralis TaxID=45668 RepID=A0A845DSG0_9BACI|nr:diacylglycerol kinase family protein [Halobacillus litoralis]MYL20088.1 YegS/Rv2252/BmrU family lipid kinase [Halobacillus litoralis]
MYILIVNPAAGNGRGLKLFKQLKKTKEYHRQNIRTFFTKASEGAEALAAELSKIEAPSLKACLVLGGDGTLHEVINGWKPQGRVPICFLPAGSGNDFARGLGVKAGILPLFKAVLRNPEEHHVYLGNYRLPKGEERTFLNNIGIGFDGAVASYADRPAFRIWMRRLHLTKWIYPAALICALPSFKPFEVEVKLDGQAPVMEKVMMITMTNHPYFGGGMKLAPRSDFQHPRMSVILVRALSKQKLLTLFLSVFIGKHTALKEVVEWEADTVHIRTKHETFFQVDGQPSRSDEWLMKKASSKTTFLSNS